eukprot:1147791-Pelagomonas_calceolata.AAC.1
MRKALYGCPHLTVEFKADCHTVLSSDLTAEAQASPAKNVMLQSCYVTFKAHSRGTSQPCLKRHASVMLRNFQSSQQRYKPPQQPGQAPDFQPSLAFLHPILRLMQHDVSQVTLRESL